ncbi:MAG: hypothetical protein ABIJ31_01400 [Pseudomonadota bacterium]
MSSDKNKEIDQNQDLEKIKDIKKPDCYGCLEKVFPMTDSGLRQTPERCHVLCVLKTDCLKQAMTTKQGTQVEEEILERGSKAGVINFFERWSRKKQIHRKNIK